MRPRWIQRIGAKGEAAPIKLESDLIKAPSYRDGAVMPGKSISIRLSGRPARQ